MAPKKKIQKKNLEYVGDVTYPLLEKTIIHHYKRYRGDDKHYYVKCVDTLFNDEGVRCQCAMELTREDHFKTWLIKNEHICTPGKPADQMTLYEFMNKVDGQKGNIVTEDILYQHMAIFAGKKNLPLETITSDEFYDMIYVFITYGLTLGFVSNPAELATKSFKPIRREKLKYIMMNVAYQKHREILNKFSSFTYVSVAMDEGSTVGIQNLHFVVESPISKTLKSYPYYTTRMEGGKTKDYLKAIPKGLFHLENAGITIGSIVIDGNTAQKKALSPSYPKSLYYKLQLHNFKHVLIIPCLCHRIHNAYKKVAQQNVKLKELVTFLHDTSIKCRENAKSIGAICPQHIDTRWACDYDIVDFILNHRIEVQDVIHKDIIKDKFEKLRNALRVFKFIISTFENPKTQLKDAFVILEKAIYCLRELKKRTTDKYPEELAQSLASYTLEASDGGIWSLAYLLSSTGRDDFRERNIHQSNPIYRDYLKFFHIEEEEEEEQSPILNTPDSEEVLMTTNGQLINDLDDIDSDDDESFSDDYEEEDISDDEIYEDDAEPDTNYKNCIESAKEMLKVLLKNRGLDRNEIQKAIQLINAYLEEEEPFSDYIVYGTGNYSWSQIKGSSKDWQDIADIALRLHSSSTSEASCERAISRQRNIHTKKRKKSKKDLLDVRMILQSI